MSHTKSHIVVSNLCQEKGFSFDCLVLPRGSCIIICKVGASLQHPLRCLVQWPINQFCCHMHVWVIGGGGACQAGLGLGLEFSEVKWVWREMQRQCTPFSWVFLWVMGPVTDKASRRDHGQSGGVGKAVGGDAEETFEYRNAAEKLKNVQHERAVAYFSPTPTTATTTTTTVANKRCCCCCVFFN